MLAPFAELLAEQRAAGRGLGAFTCYDLETARAVLGAADDAGVGVVLLVSSNSFAARAGDQLVAALRGAAEQAPARACLQLDHVADLELIAAAFELGCGAVMADGSRLPLEENIALAAEAAALARRAGGSIEVELGHVSGDEDVASAAKAGKLTDPADVPGFVAATGAACLAVSIGNAHGEYATPPQLDWSRLAGVRAVTGVALSLHGASGLAEGDLRRAIASGITKVNVNTALREAYLAATAAAVPDVQDGLNVLALHERQTHAVHAVAAETLASFVPEGP